MIIASTGPLGRARSVMTIWGLAKLLQLPSARYPAFRQQLRRHDLCLQLRLLDSSAPGSCLVQVERCKS